jgi:hypothetical protein
MDGLASNVLLSVHIVECVIRIVYVEILITVLKLCKHMAHNPGLSKFVDIFHVWTPAFS